MGDGTKESPYTREDVLKLIKENSGTAIVLDLSGKVFEEGIDLSKLNLDGIILRNAWLVGVKLKGSRLVASHLERAFLVDAHLEGAILGGAYLEGAWLIRTHLEGANLYGAYLEGADLSNAHLEGVRLGYVRFSSDTRIDNSDWGSYIIGEEKNGAFVLASDTYRRLKMWYTEHGIYDVAGEFFYREMEVKRKALKWWPNPLPKTRQTLYWLLCGYGERPLKVVISGISVLLVFVLLYFLSRGVAPYDFTMEAFLGSLYYSAVSFTALGYGPWFSANSVRSWVQGVGATEAFIGVFMMALFLITLTRKMTR